jgi:hypothetical protein
MNKYKDAEKALLLIAELQEEQNSSFIEQENQNKINNPYADVPEASGSSLINELYASPKQTKNVALVINVD